MNLLLLAPEELSADGTATLSGRRARHAREVLAVSPGESLRAGVLGGRIGRATVLRASAAEIRVRVELDSDPPPRPGVDLLLALPRPKALKKVLPAIASLGVDRVVLVNAARVEKSYFDSKVLAPASLAELLQQGLEQARDTQPPEVLVRERFRPFVEDELDALFAADPVRLAAHPSPDGAPAAFEGSAGKRALLAVGPEGGWVPFELELFARCGFRRFSAGPRILRVEAAVPYLLGRLAAG